MILEGLILLSFGYEVAQHIAPPKENTPSKSSPTILLPGQTTTPRKQDPEQDENYKRKLEELGITKPKEEISERPNDWNVVSKTSLTRNNGLKPVDARIEFAVAPWYSLNTPKSLNFIEDGSYDFSVLYSPEPQEIVGGSWTTTKYYGAKMLFLNGGARETFSNFGSEKVNIYSDWNYGMYGGAIAWFTEKKIRSVEAIGFKNQIHYLPIGQVQAQNTSAYPLNKKSVLTPGFKFNYFGLGSEHAFFYNISRIFEIGAFIGFQLGTSFHATTRYGMQFSFLSREE